MITFKEELPEMRLGINALKRNLWQRGMAARTTLPLLLTVTDGAPAPPAAPAESASAQLPLPSAQPPARPVASAQRPTTGAADAWALTYAREFAATSAHPRRGSFAGSLGATGN